MNVFFFYRFIAQNIYNKLPDKNKLLLEQEMGPTNESKTPENVN